jgi:hypothetical protein
MVFNTKSILLKTQTVEAAADAAREAGAAGSGVRELKTFVDDSTSTLALGEFAA